MQIGQLGFPDRTEEEFRGAFIRSAIDIADGGRAASRSEQGGEVVLAVVVDHTDAESAQGERLRGASREGGLAHPALMVENGHDTHALNLINGRVKGDG